MGKDLQGDNGDLSPVKPSNGSTPTTTSRRMTSHEPPKTEPVGNALQSPVLQPTDDDVRLLPLLSRPIYILDYR